MFELPQAKRIRREDLEGNSSEEDGEHDEQYDAELRAKLHAQLESIFVLDDLELPSLIADEEKPNHRNSKHHTAADAENDDGQEEFAFRLFRTDKATTKVVLPVDDALLPKGEGHFVVPKRPSSYYLAGEPTAKQRAEFDFAAVTGEDVLERSRQRWWGMEMPWRVTNVTVHRKTNDATKEVSVHVTTNDAAAPTKRKRPGKRKRIVLRTKERTQKKQEEEAGKQIVNKEEHLKEKKKRLNRLKKLKRRAKDKDKKQGVVAGGASGQDGADTSSDESDE